MVKKSGILPFLSLREAGGEAPLAYSTITLMWLHQATLGAAFQN